MTPDEFKNWRTSLGFTQARAGLELGVTDRAIRMYESGDRRISKTISILCGLLWR